MRSPNRVVGIVAGGVYLLIGFLGFTVTSGVGFFSSEGGQLLGVLGTNALLNVVQILIGAALLLAALSSTRAAGTVNSVVGALCLILGLAGLFLVGSIVNVLAVNVADNVLHFGTAAVLLAVGLGADKDIDKRPKTPTEAPTRAPRPRAPRPPRAHDHPRGAG